MVAPSLRMVARTPRRRRPNLPSRLAMVGTSSSLGQHCLLDTRWRRGWKHHLRQRAAIAHSVTVSEDGVLPFLLRMSKVRLVHYLPHPPEADRSQTLSSRRRRLDSRRSTGRHRLCSKGYWTGRGGSDLKGAAAQLPSPVPAPSRPPWARGRRRRRSMVVTGILEEARTGGAFWKRKMSVEGF